MSVIARRIGYLASSYPRAVDTAVRNEVVGLRELGHYVDTFAIRRADADQLTSDLHRREHERTTYILSDHWLVTPLAALELMVRKPARVLSALRLAMRTRPRGVRGAIWQAAYFLEAAFLAKQLLDRRIQHLHVHIGESPASVALLASELSGIAYSMTIHGPYIFRAPEYWALGTKIERAAFTVCITEFTKSQCMMYVPYTCWERLEVIRCGPELSFLRRNPPPLRDSARIVWVGRICEEKAIPILLDATERLSREGVKFELVMVGDGPLRGQVEARLQSSGLSDRVRITGWADVECVRREIEEARALVLPSFAEGLPAVLMEALALGRPAISTYVAGIPELIEPGVNGWLVPAGSEVHLAAAVRQALELPLNELARMGRAGRASVLEHHDPRVEVGKLARRIEQCIAEGINPVATTESGQPASAHDGG